MKKKTVLIGVTVLIIATIVAITLFIIKRNRVDYFIPVADGNSSGEQDMETAEIEEDVFYEEDYEDIDYSKIERKSTGKLKEAQSIYEKVSLGDTLDDITSALGQPNEIESDDNSYYTDVSYRAPSGEYVVNFVLEDGSVYEKNLYLLSSVRTGVFLSTELGTEIEDISTLAENIQEEMALEEVVKILGDKYYEVREDYYSGKWLSWCDENEEELSICFDDGIVVDIMY